MKKQHVVSSRKFDAQVRLNRRRARDRAAAAAERDYHKHIED